MEWASPAAHTYCRLSIPTPDVGNKINAASSIPVIDSALLAKPSAQLSLLSSFFLLFFTASGSDVNSDVRTSEMKLDPPACRLALHFMLRRQNKGLVPLVPRNDAVPEWFVILYR